MEKSPLDFVLRSNTASVLINRWIFRQKQIGSDRKDCEMFKKFLVTRGFQQVHGIAYRKTFASVINLTALRLFLASVAVEDLKIREILVKTIFLYGGLDAHVLIEQPKGFVNQEETNRVCKLQETLCVLK